MLTHMTEVVANVHKDKLTAAAREFLFRQVDYKKKVLKLSEQNGEARQPLRDAFNKASETRAALICMGTVETVLDQLKESLLPEAHEEFGDTSEAADDVKKMIADLNTEVKELFSLANLTQE